MNLLISCENKAQNVTVYLHFNARFTAKPKNPLSTTVSKL